MSKVSRLLPFIFLVNICYAQTNGIKFASTDTALERAFNWAKTTALGYKGKPGDPVGPWYESALPPRSAFCMRDVSHQSIGGELLGLQQENKNMFTLFVKNISAARDWCSYWEINRSGLPAPEDYRNDTAFWYNLNANFDLLNACWKLYLWTGDKYYISSPAFSNFHQKTTNEFIASWVLQQDSLLTRATHPNAGSSFNEQDAFHRCRGLASYSEGVPDIKLGIDLVAAIYRGLVSYGSILKANGNYEGAALAAKKAKSYQQHIDRYWWDDQAKLYHTYYDSFGKFGKNEGETFLLWFDALVDSVRVSNTIKHILLMDNNVENLSYHALIYYRYGYWKQAHENIIHLADPNTARNEYPEVSFGMLEAVVQGLMGVDADANFNRVSTVFRDTAGTTAKLEAVPVLNTLISIEHLGSRSSRFSNNGERAVTWRAIFPGRVNKIVFNGTKVIAKQQQDRQGNVFSYADIKVKPGKTVLAATSDFTE